MNSTLNNLPLPDSVLADLRAGRRPLSDEQIRRLEGLLKEIESPWGDLYDLETMQRENKFWASEHVHFYLGQESTTSSPGNIDPKLAVIIGQAEADSPIVLDYRTSPPRVVYLSDQNHWIELFPSYEALAAAIAPPP